MESDSAAGSPVVSSPTAVKRRRDETDLVALTLACLKRSGRNALFAALARTVLGIAKVLVKRRFDGLLKRFGDELLTLNPFKWAAIVAAFGMFQPLREGAARLLGNRPGSRGSPLRAAIASGAAGTLVAQSVRVMEQSTRTELTLYLVVRAAHVLVSQYVLPCLPKQLRDFEHYDAVTMGLTGGQILYAIVFSPLSHSAAYMDFLQRCTQLSKDQCSSIAAFHRAQPTPGLVREIERRAIFSGTNPTELVASMSCMCRTFHLNAADGCGVNAAKWLLKHLTGFSLPLYAPLKVSTTLLFGGVKPFVKRPVATVTKLVSSILASSLFLTIYCGGPLVSLCATSQGNLRGGYIAGVLAGFTCAFATFIEPKPRRLDLALYCCMHALRSVWLTANHRGYLPRPTRTLILTAYAAAVSVLLHHAVVAPSAFPPKLRSALGHIVGRPAAGTKSDE